MQWLLDITSVFVMNSKIFLGFHHGNLFCSLTCLYLSPLFSCSFPPSFLFSVWSVLPPLFFFHNLFALCLSNKSHIIVHFLSWPGAWCQTSCMKCSFTASLASTFVQRRNNNKKIIKSHRASWTLKGFFPPFEEEAKQLLIHYLFYHPVP